MQMIMVAVSDAQAARELGEFLCGAGYVVAHPDADTVEVVLVEARDLAEARVEVEALLGFWRVMRPDVEAGVRD